MTNDASPVEVAGIPDRFKVLRQVGEGGMGVVYEAIDKHRGDRVALKTLPKLEPVALYRFKQEFRVLTGLVHFCFGLPILALDLPELLASKSELTLAS